ncbi:hypothetical protein DSM112329_03202 [Paraconexibacter sp. AEG42_29]|uniref:Uncharacterized protein n=1 Tax=Paraconexibacter sp. AEG42_29 TaxID=2997339 RepID=A0AAU7AXJ7_9ACTN
MGIVLATTAGLIVWIVLWSLDVKAIDGFMITVVIVLLAGTVRMVAPFLPGAGGGKRPS